MPTPEAQVARVRELAEADLDAVIAIDAQHTGSRKLAYWLRVFSGYARRSSPGVALGTEVDGKLVGYVFGDVRAFEFGSDECGWIFAVGVDLQCARRGIAKQLLEAAVAWFAGAGVATVRTMVRRDDVPVLSLFRSSRFVGGPFVQLERGLESPDPEQA